MQHKQQRAFLTRPWYRDWVLSYVFIGMGFMLSSRGGPLEGWPGLVVMCIGACMFIAAVAHELAMLVRRR